MLNALVGLLQPCLLGFVYWLLYSFGFGFIDFVCLLLLLISVLGDGVILVVLCVIAY